MWWGLRERASLQANSVVAAAAPASAEAAAVSPVAAAFEAPAGAAGGLVGVSGGGTARHSREVRGEPPPASVRGRGARAPEVDGGTKCGDEQMKVMIHWQRRVAWSVITFAALLLSVSALIGLLESGVPSWDAPPGRSVDLPKGDLGFLDEAEIIPNVSEASDLPLPFMEEVRPWSSVAMRRTATEETSVNAARLKAVKNAIMHAWGGYKQYAWGMDELMPLSRRGKKWFGLGVTLVDALDLLWLVGEREEFYGAMEWVEQELDPSSDTFINVFEATIRVVGGLLAAYHYSQEDVFLRKATELGARMKSAFDSESGVPFSDVHLKTGEAFAPADAPASSTSEATSIQVEFKYLAYLTDDEDLYNLAHRSMDAIQNARRRLPRGFNSLVPMYINANTGQFVQNSIITLGARGDSYYEYLLKQWLLTGKRETHYLDQYVQAVDAIEKKLLAYSWPHRVAFIGELGPQRKKLINKMDHLVCFLPGTLALGYYHGLDSKHLDLARELILTCFELYNTTVTGLAPEIAHFNTDSQGEMQYDIIIKAADAHNILRPETVESLYYMHRITGQRIYREWGWKIFQAFERHSRVATGGYSGLSNVQDLQSPKVDKMESFWLGETLKYFYLLFSDEDLVPLDRYVFNTEAHPIPVFTPPWLVKEEPVPTTTDLAASL